MLFRAPSAKLGGFARGGSRGTLLGVRVEIKIFGKISQNSWAIRRRRGLPRLVGHAPALPKGWALQEGPGGLGSVRRADCLRGDFALQMRFGSSARDCTTKMTL